MIFETKCKDCAFAKWSDDGKTQLDCHMGVFQKLTSIKDVEEDGKIFKVIEGEFCPFIRPLFWNKDKSIEEKVASVLKETAPSVSAFILVDSNEYDLIKSIKAVENQTSPFSEAFFVVTKRSQLTTKEVFETIQSLNMKTKASVTQIIVDLEKEEDFLDYCYEKSSSTYLAKFYSGEYISTSYVAYVNWLKENMIKFLMVIPELQLITDNGTLVLKNIYKDLGGNQEVEWADGERVKTFKRKLEKIAEDQHCDWAIRKIAGGVS